MGALAPHEIGELGIVRRIRAAREHLIVPHEKPEFIADFVEGVLFILSAAPETDHVHIRRFRALKQIAVTRRSLFVLERGAGNPVRAFHENGAAVHLERQSAARRIDLDFPKPDAPRDLLAAGGDRVGMKALLALTGRPPERRIGDLFAVRHHAAVAHLGVRGQRAVRHVIVELRVGIHVFDAPTLLRRDELHGPAETDHHLRRSPVPALVTGVLAHKRVIVRPLVLEPDDLHVVGGIAAIFRGEFVTAPDRASEDTPDDVSTDPKIRLHIELPAQKPVARLADLAPVDEDFGEAVDIFRPQNDLFRRKKPFRNVEFPFNRPVVVADPLHVRFVAAPKRIIDQLRLVKSVVDAAGNGDRAFNRRTGFVHAGKAPIARKVDFRGRKK